MFAEYYRHLLRPFVHEHFPHLERPVRVTIEDENSFISVIREYNQFIRIDTDLIKKMKKGFWSYIKRRSGSIKNPVLPCTGTVGRWNSRRSMEPIMEITFECYDSVFYKNWIESSTLDRLTWNNIIVVSVIKSHCPHGHKCGMIFIID